MEKTGEFPIQIWSRSKVDFEADFGAGTLRLRLGNYLLPKDLVDGGEFLDLAGSVH